MAKMRSLFSILALSLLPHVSQAAERVNLTVGYQPYDTISYSAVVIRGLELWKKHLPAGSSVDFQAALQGAIIVNAMLADKQQIGYLGDMPAVVSTTKTKQASVKLVASTGLSAGQRCNVIMVRADAPAFGGDGRDAAHSFAAMPRICPSPRPPPTWSFPISPCSGVIRKKCSRKRDACYARAVC